MKSLSFTWTIRAKKISLGKGILCKARCLIYRNLQKSFRKFDLKHLYVPVIRRESIKMFLAKVVAQGLLGLCLYKLMWKMHTFVETKINCLKRRNPMTVRALFAIQEGFAWWSNHCMVLVKQVKFWIPSFIINYFESSLNPRRTRDFISTNVKIVFLS